MKPTNNIEIEPVQFVVFSKLLFFIIKYLIAPIAGVLLCLGEIPFPPISRRVQFIHYDRLPLWEGKIIVALTHNSWLDAIIAALIYFPWWFREILKDILDLAKDLWLFFVRLGHFIIDERVKIKVKTGDNVIFSKDVPMTAADKYNLRHFQFLRGWLFYINRAKGREAKKDRSRAYRLGRMNLNSGGRINVFAEGGMLDSALKEEKIYDVKTHQPILRLLQPGVGQWASETGAKIVPVRIIGADKILPRRKFPFPRFWHRLIIIIGEPLVFPVGTPPKEITEKLTSSLINLWYEGQKK